MKNILKSVIIISLSTLVILFSHYYILHNINYWKSIGMNHIGLYDNIVKLKGEPLSIEYPNAGGAYVCCKGLKFYYSYADLRGTFLRVEIIDDTYSFGYKHISVGDKKEKIIDFYKHSKKVLGLSENKRGYFFYDGIIYFDFDENDIVQKIILTWEL